MIEPTLQSYAARQSALNTVGVRFAAGSQSPNWSLNQVLDAQVIRLTTGDVALRINGQAYTPVGAHAFLPGTQRQLRVDSLDPVVKLSVISKGGEENSGMRLQPSTVVANMSGAAWAATISSSHNKLATLLSVFHRVPDSLARQLSAHTLSSIYTLSGWIPNLHDLREPNRLKGLFRELNQLVGLKSGIEASPNSQGLSRLLAEVRSSLAAQLSGLRNNDEQLGLVRSYSGDRSLQKAHLQAAMFLIDDAIRQHGATQRRSHDPWIPWQFVLPYRYEGKCRSLRINANSRKRGRKIPTQIEFWKVTCSGEFPNLGKIEIHIGLSDKKCGLNLHCANPEACQQIQDHKPLLEQQLDELGIRLIRLRSSVKHDFEDEPVAQEIPETAAEWTPDWDLPDSVSEALELANRENKIPQLSEFELSGCADDENELGQMPEKIYQTLACLFVFFLNFSDEEGETE